MSDRGERVVITKLVQEDAFAKNGMCVGDEVLRVNGVETDRASVAIALVEASRLVRGEVRVLLRRAEKKTARAAILACGQACLSPLPSRPRE
jgi:PDZ domain-containing secreted protein